MSEKFSIGLDFGTEAVRAVLVRVNDGEIFGTATYPYPNGVIDQQLPGTQISLPPNWALQDPRDWLSGVETTILRVLNESGVSGENVVGIGIDFTSCTVLPTSSVGKPMCFFEEFRNEPHAWAKLWKHHGAQTQADRINEIASERDQALLNRYGGKISSEWLLPKALEILDDQPEFYAKIDFIIEGADWVVWQLTNSLARNTCCSGYKGTWHKQMGYPNEEFLRVVHPDLEKLFTTKVSGRIFAPGEVVGGLSDHWAERLKLMPGCPVSAPIIDAHAATIGAGVTEPGEMFLIMGTSTCHMYLSETEVLLEGISGVVEDGIIPELFGYEAGQVSVGDIFAWFVENCVPEDYYFEARKRKVSIHRFLSEKASKLQPGESGLLALDWWNGCRTPLVDADLTGLLLGLNLQTKPEDIYRALIEATAYGTRLIMALFTKNEMPVNKIIVSGGLTQNDLIMTLYADILQLPVHITASPLASAQGAAILGAVAGRSYPSIQAAVKNMVKPPSKIIETNNLNSECYSDLYQGYKWLIDQFGGQADSIMKLLNNKRKNTWN
jgi:L-ribulokinase